MVSRSPPPRLILYQQTVTQHLACLFQGRCCPMLEGAPSEFNYIFKLPASQGDAFTSYMVCPSCCILIRYYLSPSLSASMSMLCLHTKAHPRYLNYIFGLPASEDLASQVMWYILSLLTWVVYLSSIHLVHFRCPWTPRHILEFKFHM